MLLEGIHARFVRRNTTLKGVEISPCDALWVPDLALCYPAYISLPRKREYA